MQVTNDAASIDIGALGHRAGIQDNQIGGGWVANSRVALGFERSLNRSAIRLRRAASETSGQRRVLQKSANILSKMPY